MSATHRGEWIDYECARIDGPAACSAAATGPRGSVLPRRARSLEWFLAERYCLYTTERGKLHRARSTTSPGRCSDWAEIELNSVAPRGVRLPDDEPATALRAAPAGRRDLVSRADRLSTPQGSRPFRVFLTL